jgi:N-acetylmuramoyl-L-alanine amidase
MIQIVKPEHLLRVIEGPVRNWKHIVFHHTATDMNRDIHYGERVDAWHRVERHWEHGMGYHILINPDGTVEVGNRWINQLDGAHCPGQNKIAIGVAMVGNFEIMGLRPTIDALETWWQVRAMLQPRPVYPHCLFKATACPGALFTEDIRTWFKLIDKPNT